MSGAIIPRDDVLLAGASGLIGRELLRLLGARAAPSELHLLLRRPLGLPLPPGVHEHVVNLQLLPPLPQARDVYCALGTTLKAAGSAQAFRAVDFDAVLAVAQAAHRAGARRLAVVSSVGANPRSRHLYNRVKGEMETAVSEIGFESLVIARPSLLLGDRASLGQPARPAERWAQALSRPLAPFLPSGLRPIAAATVARALLAAMNEARHGLRVLDSAELQSLGV